MFQAGCIMFFLLDSTLSRCLLTLKLPAGASLHPEKGKAPYLHSVAVNLPRFVRKILYIAVLSTF